MVRSLLKITIKEQSKLFRMELLKYHYNIQNLLFLGKQHLSIMDLILPMETKMRQIHLFLGRSYPQRNEFANFAIWELVFLDHDATEEELTKIKDYFVKTYPWLFPDQAWTVVGKTNEDEDRATIANITGNDNDLVLSNFGFAEGSGYGLYAQNYISYAITNRAVYTKTNSSIHVTKSITAGVNFTESARNVTIPSYRIKVTGIQSGQEMIYRGSNNTF